MRKTKYIIPILVYTKLLAQQDKDVFVPNVEFGFCNGAFTSITNTRPDLNPANTSKREPSKMTQPLSQITYGFNYGMFLWVKASDQINIKPELNFSFSNYKLEDRLQKNKSVYATSFDFSIANQVIVNLKPNDTHGIIKIAKCMSYYLTSKQPYVLIGPKVSYRKFDRGFLQKGFENEASIGIVAGYGINYGFHNMNFAPEIKYSLEVSPQNIPTSKQKIIHSITLAINLF